MTCIRNLLEPFCSDVENELKPKLRGLLTGAIIGGYLPQNWVFKTEFETITFYVDRKGSASVKDEDSGNPDVTIEVDHDFLAEALKTRIKPSFEPKQLNITCHTQKGKTAFDFLKGKLGL